MKFGAPFIISPLTYICNAVLSTGVFPARLKYAIVETNFKKRKETRDFQLQANIFVNFFLQDY
jgi:hypothetical protein